MITGERPILSIIAFDSGIVYVMILFPGLFVCHKMYPVFVLVVGFVFSHGYGEQNQ